MGAGAPQVVEFSIPRVKGERYEGLKSAGFILQPAELKEVIDSVSVGFEVSVEHGSVGAEAETVSGAHGIKPFIRVRLAVTEILSQGGVEDLGASPGHGAEAGSPETREDILYRTP